MGSRINPFDSQETKPLVMALRDGSKLMIRYKNDPQILAMTNLVSAYQDRNVQEAEKILSGKLSFALSSWKSQLTNSKPSYYYRRPIYRLFHQ
jgi:hypothetical protein